MCNPKTTEIVAAQVGIVKRASVRFFDPLDPLKECWACGDERALEKAHIVAHAAGGTSDPDNYLLLCRECHKEQPDGASYDAQLRWLFTHETYIDRWLRLATDIVAQFRDQPLANAWAAQFQIEPFLTSLRCGASNYNNIRNSIKFEMFANYERWKAAVDEM